MVPNVLEKLTERTGGLQFSYASFRCKGMQASFKALVKRSGVVPNFPLATQVGALCLLQNKNFLRFRILEFTESTSERVGSTLEIDIVASALRVSPAPVADFKYSRS